MSYMFSPQGTSFSHASYYIAVCKFLCPNIYPSTRISTYTNTSLSVECHNSLLKKWENQCPSKETRTCASNNHIETYQKIKTPVRNDSARRIVIIIIYDDGGISTLTCLY